MPTYGAVPPQAVLRTTGVKLMRELLAWASSVMDTLPLCLMNWATELSSSGVMKINLPLSSITPRRWRDRESSRQEIADRGRERQQASKSWTETCRLGEYLQYGSLTDTESPETSFYKDAVRCLALAF